MIKKKYFNALTIFILGSSSFVNAQENNVISTKSADSLSYKAYVLLTKQFDVLRPIDIEYMYSGPTKFTSNYEDKKTEGNKIKNTSLVKVSTTINLLKKNKWLLNTSLGLKKIDADYDFFDLNENKLLSRTMDANYLYGSVNLTHNTKLFNKYTFLTSNIIVDGNDEFIGRAKAYISGNILLKSSENTKILAGLLINIDESSNTPVIPLFTLQHKLKNGNSIDIILPKQIYYRMRFLTKSRLSIGSELASNSFYFSQILNNNQVSKFEYKQVDLNTGIKFEHLLLDNLILSARTGINTLVRNAVLNKGDRFNDRFLYTDQKSQFFFNIGISYNPFIKNKK